MIWAFFLAAANKGFFREVADSKPSDDLTNGELENLAKLIEDDVYGKNVTMFIVTILVVLVDVALYVKKRYSKNKKNGVQPN